jgi:hypothetical protein
MKRKISFRKLVFILLFIIIFICLFVFFCYQIFYFSLKDDFTFESQIFDFSVRFYDKNLSYNGYNICGNLLFDMEGNLIEKINIKQVWYFDSYNKKLITSDISKENKIDYYDNYTFNNIILKNNLHHDLSLSSNNDTILYVSNDVYNYKNRSVLFDTFYEMGFDGEIIKNWSTYDNLENLHKYFSDTPLDFVLDVDYFNNMRGGYQSNFDNYTFYEYFHANYIQSLPHNIYEKNDSRFKFGNWLISLPSVGLIAIIDYDSGDLMWEYGLNIIDGQHCSQMIDNGNILIFDNQYPPKNNKHESRVIEINPITKEIVWEYNQSDFKKYSGDEFYTGPAGCAQRLPNNNTIIVLSDKGRVIEVTYDKRVVWDWINPNIEDGHLTTYRFERINDSQKDILMDLLSLNING